MGKVSHEQFESSFQGGKGLRMRINTRVTYDINICITDDVIHVCIYIYVCVCVLTFGMYYVFVGSKNVICEARAAELLQQQFQAGGATLERAFKGEDDEIQ